MTNYVACAKYMVIQIFELHWKVHAARIKLGDSALWLTKWNRLILKAAQVDVVSS